MKGLTMYRMIKVETVPLLVEELNKTPVKTVIHISVNQNTGRVIAIVEDLEKPAAIAPTVKKKTTTKTTNKKKKVSKKNG